MGRANIRAIIFIGSVIALGGIFKLASVEDTPVTTEKLATERHPFIIPKEIKLAHEAHIPSNRRNARRDRSVARRARKRAGTKPD